MPGFKPTMEEYKAGKLHSGSKAGPVVTNPKQAVAIAYSESGERKMHHKGSKHHAPIHHGKEHVGFAEHHHFNTKPHEPGRRRGHDALTAGFAHNAPSNHENAASHKDGKKHGAENFNPVEHGYGFGRHHDGATDHGVSIAGSSDAHTNDSGEQWIAGAIKHPGKFSKAAKKHHMGTHAYAEKEKHKGGTVGKEANLALTLSKFHHSGQKHAHDSSMHSIAGDKMAGEHHSKLRSRDGASEHKQPRGERTGERYDIAHGDREGEFHLHHIEGGVRAHHEFGSGKAEHHPHSEREPHRFHGGRVEGAHGYGHSVEHRKGHHRHSGHPGAHRIGHRG